MPLKNIIPLKTITAYQKIMMKNVILLTALLIGTFLQAQQTEFVKTFTVEEAVQYAISNNYDAKNSKLDVTKARWRNWEIKSMGLPTLSATAEYDYYFKQPQIPSIEKIFNDPNSVNTQVFSYLAMKDPNIAQMLYNYSVNNKDTKISFVLPHNLNTSLTLSQLLLDGRYFIGLKATRDFLKVARLQKDLSDQDIRYNVMKAYYQAQAAKESQQYLEEVKVLVEKLTSDTRKIYKEGLTEELDVNRLELTLSNLESQLNITEKMATVALANLKFQMGLDLGSEIILTDKISDLRAKMDPSVLPNFEPSKRLEYQLLETVTRVRHYDTQQRRSGHFPSLVAFLNYGWQSQVDNFSNFFKSREVSYPDGDVRKKSNWYQTGLVGIKLSIPIFDSGNKMAQTQQGKIDEQKSKNDFDKFKQASALQFQSSQAFFAQALSEEQYSQKSVELSQKIFTKTNIKFKEGVGNSFELVQAQQDLIQNRLKFIQAQLNLLNTKADLDKAIGK